MSKSKKDNWSVDLFGEDIELDLESTFSIDLDKTYGTTTTTLVDTIVIGDGTNSITTNSSDWITTANPSFNKWDVITDTTISFPWESEYRVWRDCMPSLQEVEDMCKQYPALRKAYENFKTVYDMVEQDYKGRKEDDS